jgi:CO/xanthine dehydrogenase Mo-binding subunit
MRARTIPRSTRARTIPRPTRERIPAPIQRPGYVGETTTRADAVPKVKGEFAYSSDMRAEGMLYGATLRSPHPRALIAQVDITPALALPGVHAVLTHEDVPGRKLYGMEKCDQPVLAFGEVRYQGEPVAIVAAETPEGARRAADAISVEYLVLKPVCDPKLAMAPDAPALHESGNVLRHVVIRHGDPKAHADIVVSGEYEVGMQDQAFLGPESGLAVPDGEGGIDLYIATQWLHADHGQLAACLALPPENVRLTQAGVGGAFGGREDLSMQVHACMLALHTSRPVRIAYSREESFFGHVHRHPCTMRYEHGSTKEGKLVFVRARIVLDGGAYASSSTAVCSNAACFACGPYAVPSAAIDSFVTYTNNPPCGAMRGFGAVQVAFAHEAQMDKLAAAVGTDPVELRILNAIKPGDRLTTGQVVPEPAPVAELLERLRAMPLPLVLGGQLDLRELPGGVANTTHGEGVRRGVGFAVGIKNIGFSEGFDDYSTARVRICIDGGEPLVEVHTAAVEVGQGIVTVQAQIARTELGIERVKVLTPDTSVGSAGSSSASRQTYVTGGAVKAACEAVRERLGADPRELSVSDLLALIGPEGVEETIEWRHPPTFELDENGQGDAHVQFAFSAHRAVVDVDIDLGLVRVVELATTQEVGRAMNPQALEGQIEGGTAQGLGLALLEEIRVRDGKVLNASFTDYLLPTVLDMPPVRIEILEHPDPASPYGLKGVGEPPHISTPPAILSALRDACGRELKRIPVRPEHIVGLPT